MIKREVLSKTGLFNENLKMAEDYELWLRIGSVGQMWNLSEPLLVYRESKPTFYKPLNKKDDYQYKAMVLGLTLERRGNLASPLKLPENDRLAHACRNEIEFLKKGPRFLGRARHWVESLSCVKGR